MARTYGGHADFVTVYIKEAHPTDEWQVDANVTEDVCYAQPKTTAQRLAIANDFVRRFDYPIPMVVDDIENTADTVYAGWPERFYIVDENGTIVYKGETGPSGFHPEEVESWLRQRFGSRPTARPAAAASRAAA